MERQRLDKWLWHARVVKARTSAAALVEGGQVRINGMREKSPGHAVKIGDVLTIALDNSVRVLKVRDFPSGAAMPLPRACCMRICSTGRNNCTAAGREGGIFTSSASGETEEGMPAFSCTGQSCGS